MSNFPTSVPIPIKTGQVTFNEGTATYNTNYGSIKFNMDENPVRMIDGDYRQCLMKSIEGDWFIETNSGGISLPFVRLFHQIYLMKLPKDHPLVQGNKV